MTSTYQLSLDADNDLQDIARYTLKNWGPAIFQEYRNGLKDRFKDISEKNITRKSFSNKFPEIYVTKYRYHFIFYLHETNKIPLIIGIIHEQRDIVSRISERLQ